jgi:hypothetical protein
MKLLSITALKCECYRCGFESIWAAQTRRFDPIVHLTFARYNLLHCIDVQRTSLFDLQI